MGKFTSFPSGGWGGETAAFSESSRPFVLTGYTFTCTSIHPSAAATRRSRRTGGSVGNRTTSILRNRFSVKLTGKNWVATISDFPFASLSYLASRRFQSPWTVCEERGRRG